MQAAAWILLALAALALFAAAVNVSGLALLRGEARAGEYALKAALGASPLRMVREALVESLLLSALGTAAAVSLAWAALKAAARWWVLPSDFSMTLDARIDHRMATLAIACALLSTLLCALAPARTAFSISAPRPAGNSRLRAALVILQIALAAALLGTGASLLAGMRAAGHVDLGYRTDHILTMAFDPSQTQADETRARAFYRDLLQRTAILSGVRAAALAQSIPLGFTAAQKQIKIAAAGPDAMPVWMNTVTPGYFALVRMRLLTGRDFNAGDTARTTRVAIVNDMLAKFWPGGAAVDQIVEIDGRSVQIAGIVQTAKYQQIGESPRPFFYLPFEQNFTPRMTLHIRSDGPPSAMAPSVLAAAAAIDPSQTASEIRPLDQILSQGALFTARIGLAVTSAAGGCVWALSLAGLYACIARSIQRRRREIGIRQALGATRWSIMVLVLRQGAGLTAAGVVIGLLCAACAQRWTSAILPARTPTGWQNLVLAGAMVAAASLTSCLFPAWRVARREAAVALSRPPQTL